MSDTRKNRRVLDRMKRVTDPKDAATRRRLAHLDQLRKIALEEQQKLERDAGRVIPVSGPGRRRMKALRNAGLGPFAPITEDVAA